MTPDPKQPAAKETPTTVPELVPSDETPAIIALRDLQASVERERQAHPDKKVEDIRREQLNKLDERTRTIVRAEMIRRESQGEVFAENSLDRYILEQETRENKPAAPAVKPNELPLWTMPTIDPKTKAIIGAGIATAGVIGLYMLFRKLGQKTNAAAEKTMEYASSGWRTLKWGIITALVGGGAYVGINLFQKYKETIAKLKDVDAVIASLRTQAADLKGEALASVQARIDQFEAYKTRVMNGEADAKSPTEQKVAKAVEKAKDVAEEAKEVVGVPLSISLISRSIVYFYDDETWNLGEKSKTHQIEDIVKNNKSMTMKDVLASEKPFTILGEDRENREKASSLLKAFCSDRSEDMVRFFMRRDGLDEAPAREKMLALDLETFLRESAYSFSALVPVLEKVSASKGNVAEAIQAIDFQSITQGDEMIRQQLERYVLSNAQELGLSEEDIEGVSYTEMMKAASALLIGTVGAHPPLSQNPTIEQVIIEKILNELKHGDTYRYMVPCFHEVLPGGWSEDMLVNEATVKKCLLDNMSAERAVRMYLYRQMMIDGNPVGLCMMQMEVLKFIADEDQSWVKNDKYTVINRIGKTIAGKGGRQIAEEWKKMGLELDEEMLAKAGNIVAEVCKETGSTALSIPGQTIQELGGLTASLFEEYPIIAPTTLITAAESARFARLETMNHHRMIESMEKLVGKFNNRSLTVRAGDALSSRIRLLYSQDEIREMSAQMKHVYESASSARGAALDKFTKCVRQPLRAAVWEDLAKHLDSIGDTQGAASARAIGTNSRLRSAVGVYRYLGNGSGLSRLTSFSLRGYEQLRRGTGVVLRTGASFTPRLVRGAVARGGSALRASMPALRTGARVGGRMLGGAAVAYSGYEIYDLYYGSGEQMRQQIRTEKDLGRKGLLQNQLNEKYIDVGANAAGGVLLMIPTPPTMIAGAAIVGVNYIGQTAAGSFNEATEYMLQNEHNLTGLHSGHILHQIARSANGNVSAGQTMVGWMGVDMGSANLNVRTEAYRAYFRTNAQMTMPPVGEDLVEPEYREQGEQRINERLAVIASDQESMYVNATEAYISHHTNKEYSVVSSALLQRADVYGRIAVSDWRMTKMGRKGIDFLRMDWAQREQIVETMCDQEGVDIADGFNYIKQKEPEKFEKHATTTLLLSLQHDIADFERRTRAADFTGWEWTGSEDEVRNSVRLACSLALANKIRDALKHWNSLPEIDKNAYNAAVNDCRAILSRDPATMEAEAAQFKETATRLADPASVTTPEGLQALVRPDYLKERRKNAGIALMGAEAANANDNGTYFTKQFGWIGNKFLYMRFDEQSSKWLVGLWSVEEAKHDPAKYGVSMWGGSKSYNDLIRKLADINEIDTYAAAKSALEHPGQWIVDHAPRSADMQDLVGNIEYVSPNGSDVYAQTLDGKRSWIHNLSTDGGELQSGKYFNGQTRRFETIPASGTYDRNSHVWIPAATETSTAA